jgi:hypothetical protein
MVVDADLWCAVRRHRGRDGRGLGMERSGLASRLRRLSDRQRWALAGASAVVVGALLAWALWPAPEPEPPRAREYLTYTACLLTGDKGLTDPAAAPVWAGMQQASLATHAKVQYLAVAGQQTPENGATYLASLAQGGCNLIFAAGRAPLGAVRQGAPQFPTVMFVAVGKAPVTGNVSVIDVSSAEAVQGRVSQLITDKVRATTR